jgi:hypothetical protein
VALFDRKPILRSGDGFTGQQFEPASVELSHRDSFRHNIQVHRGEFWSPQSEANLAVVQNFRPKRHGMAIIHTS